MEIPTKKDKCRVHVITCEVEENKKLYLRSRLGDITAQDTADEYELCSLLSNGSLHVRSKKTSRQYILNLDSFLQQIVQIDRL